MVLAALGGAILLRIVLKVIFHLRDEGDEDGPSPAPEQKPASVHDPFFN